MFTLLTKRCYMAPLLLALLSWTFAANYQLEVNLPICFAGAVVLIETFRKRQYRWGLAESGDDRATASRTPCGECFDGAR